MVVLPVTPLRDDALSPRLEGMSTSIDALLRTQRCWCPWGVRPTLSKPMSTRAVVKSCRIAGMARTSSTTRRRRSAGS